MKRARSFARRGGAALLLLLLFWTASQLASRLPWIGALGTSVHALGLGDYSADPWSSLAPLSMQILDSQSPWVVGIELADLEYLHLGFDPQQGVEEQLVHRAQSDDKPTAGLETLSEELGGLEALSRDDQLRLLDQTLSELKDSLSELQAVLSAWRRGDAAALAALLAREYRAFPALYRPLVTARNQRWLPQIEQLLHGERNCLVVVGALHLVGDGGLLELLRKDGFAPVQLD